MGALTVTLQDAKAGKGGSHAECLAQSCLALLAALKCDSPPLAPPAAAGPAALLGWGHAGDGPFGAGGGPNNGHNNGQALGIVPPDALADDLGGMYEDLLDLH